MRNEFVFTIHRARNAHTRKKHLKSIHSKSLLHNFENDRRLNELNDFFGFAAILEVFATLTTYVFAYAK